MMEVSWHGYIPFIIDIQLQAWKMTSHHIKTTPKHSLFFNITPNSKKMLPKDEFSKKRCLKITQFLQEKTLPNAYLVTLLCPVSERKVLGCHAQWTPFFFTPRTKKKLQKQQKRGFRHTCHKWPENKHHPQLLRWRRVAKIFDNLHDGGCSQVQEENAKFLDSANGEVLASERGRRIKA